MKPLKSRPWLLLAPLLCLLALAAGPPAPLPDDTGPLQALLDSGAATIRLEPRLYRVKTLRITRTLHLEGQGAATGLRYNGGDGLHLSGSDVNVGLATQLDLVGNGGYGIREEGISLGSTYLACHAAANGQGAYRIGGDNSFSVLLGCYSESGQPASRWGQRTFSVGGNHGAGFDVSGNPGGHVGHDWMGFRLTRVQELPLYGGPTVRAGSLPPATGARGDVILNRLPSSGQPAGWSCTRSATSSAPAQWKAWGKIE